MTPTRLDDQRIEVLIGGLLRAGVIVAASVVALGGLVYLLHHGSEPADFGVFRGEAAALRKVAAVLHGGAELRGKSIIQFGLLLLIATPIARVVFSAVAFAIERDYLYVVLTLVVLGVLLYSLLGSGVAQ